MMEREMFLRRRGENQEWELNQLLFEDDAALVADSAKEMTSLGKGLGEFVRGGN